MVKRISVVYKLMRTPFGSHLVRAVWQDRSVRAAAFTFALTRAVVFAIFILAAHLTPVEPIGKFGSDAQETQLSLRDASVLDTLRSISHRGDSGWYLDIAFNGYEHKPFDIEREHNWGFFPLFPSLWWTASKITGDFELTGLALASAFFLPALVLLHKTTLAFGNDQATADRTVFYAAVYPTSYFYSLPMTESLFLLLTVGAFYAAKREAWWLAGVIGALASATRFSAIFLFPALLILYWQTHRSLRPRANILGLFLIPAGLIAFMSYLYHATGNALAFIEVMRVLGRQPVFFLRPLLGYVSDPLLISHRWDFMLLNFSAAVLALTCGVILAKRREWALSFYTLVSIITFLSSALLQSHARYVMVLFPIFMLLARAGRVPRIDQIIRTVFLVLLGLMTALCTVLFTLALS